MKKKQIHLNVGVCLLFTFGLLKAQEKSMNHEQLDEVVVVATKFAVKKERIGKIIYQINQEELKNLKGKTVSDILNSIAGIEINGNNNAAGKNKSAYIRGGRNHQALVLIDGVPMSDPTGINSGFDLRLLTLNQIESIEVMNGSASTLYGSGAATGVIYINLKKSGKKNISLNYQSSIGTVNSQNDTKLELNEVNQNLSIDGTLDKFNYLAMLSVSSYGGLSEASDEKSAFKFKSDVFQPTNTYVRIGYNFSKKARLALLSNYDRDVYDYDAGAYSDSEINNGLNTQNRIGLTFDYNYDSGALKFITSIAKNNRNFTSFNSWSNTADQFEYIGKTLIVDVFNDYKFSDKVHCIAGFNYQTQNNFTKSPYGEIDPEFANYNVASPYVSVIYNAFSRFNLNAGLRLNVHSAYGSHMVYNVNPSYKLTENLRLIGSYSTAFISPSTYQLYSQYGNEDLKPETDTSFEAGLIGTDLNTIEINSVFFYREVENAILLPDYIKYQNSSGTRNAKGMETNFVYRGFNDFNFKFGYAYTHKSDDLDYIPTNKFTAMIASNAIENTYISLKYRNVSKRTYFDQWASGELINLKPYSILDLYGSYQIIKEKFTIFAQISNLFNENYVETIGYTTKGRNFKIGLDFNF